MITIYYMYAISIDKKNKNTTKLIVFVWILNYKIW